MELENPQVEIKEEEEIKENIKLLDEIVEGKDKSQGEIYHSGDKFKMKKAELIKIYLDWHAARGVKPELTENKLKKTKNEDIITMLDALVEVPEGKEKIKGVILNVKQKQIAANNLYRLNTLACYTVEKTLPIFTDKVDITGLADDLTLKENKDGITEIFKEILNDHPGMAYLGNAGISYVAFISGIAAQRAVLNAKSKKISPTVNSTSIMANNKVSGVPIKPKRKVGRPRKKTNICTDIPDCPL